MGVQTSGSGGLPNEVDLAFLLASPDINTLESDDKINIGAFYQAKTLSISFDTSDNIQGRQVIFEQGGGARGMNVYIEDGKLVMAAWNFAEENWGYKEVVVDIDPNSTYVATLVLDGTPDAKGTLTGFLNGEQVGQVDGVGFLYQHVGDIGVGEVQGGTVIDGEKVSGGGLEFTGTINSVVEYNAALDDEELAELDEFMGLVPDVPEDTPQGDTPTQDDTPDQPDKDVVEMPEENLVFMLENTEGIEVNTLADDEAINIGEVYEEKTVSLTFEAGADVTSRQVLFEQGGGSRGLNVFIEDGKVFVAVWNFLEENWGYKELSVDIDPGETHTVTMVMDGALPADGTLTMLLDGEEVGSVDGVGFLYQHTGDVGVGEMVQASVFHGEVVKGDGLEFEGQILKVVQYNEALSGKALSDLNKVMMGEDKVEDSPKQDDPKEDDPKQDETPKEDDPKTDVPDDTDGPVKPDLPEHNGKVWVVSDIFELESAIQKASDGDIIQIKGGDYNLADDPSFYSGIIKQGGVYVNKSLAFEGIDGTPVFHNTKPDGTPGNTVKGLFTISGDKDTNVSFDNIKFTGATNTDRNGAGIRLEAGNMTVTNSIFENNQNGILGQVDDHLKGDVIIENSTFKGNGHGDGYSHAVYLGVDDLYIANSTFSETKIGHHVKSTSTGSTTVINSVLNDGDIEGAASRAFDLTGGGDIYIIGNTVIKGPHSDSPQFIYYSAARKGGEPGEIIIKDNVFDATAYLGGQPELLVNTGDTVAFLLGNTITGISLAKLVSGLSHLEDNTLNGEALETMPFDFGATYLSSGDDVMVFDGAVAKYRGVSHTMHGGDGDDTMVASITKTNLDKFFGGNGDDIIFTFNGDDELYGGAGNDIMDGGAHNDIMAGDAGDDIMFGGNGVNTLYGGTGNDILVGGKDKDQMVGGDGDDILISGGGNKERLNGGDGDDILIGGLNQQQMHGGDGDDIVYGGHGYDLLEGAGGTDIAVYTLNFSDVNLIKAPPWQGPLAYEIKPLDKDNAPDEIGKYGEVVKSFEFIQFSDGVFNTTTGTFTKGEVLVDVDDLLAMENKILSQKPDVTNLTPNTNAETGEAKGAFEVDLMDGEADTYALDIKDVLNLSDINDVIIKGDGGLDTVEVSGDFNNAGTKSIGGELFNHLTDGISDIFVQADLNVDVI